MFSLDEIHEILRRLNPNRPASAYSSDENLPRINRPNDSINSVKRQIEIDKYTKALVAGHIGVGKSTELLNMEDELETDYFVMYLSVSTEIGSHNSNSLTVLIMLLYKIIKTWGEQTVYIPPKIIKNIVNVLKQLTIKHEGRELFTFREIDIHNYNQLISYLEQILNQITLLFIPRFALRTADISDLVIVTEIIIKEMEKKTGKPLLIIIDDLDKITDDDAALDFFMLHSKAWLRLPCAIIATLPFDMYFHERIHEIELLWGDINILDPLDVPLEDSENSGDFSFNFYSELLREIGATKLFPPNAVKRLAINSGGIIRDFIRLCAGVIHITLNTEKKNFEILRRHIIKVESNLSEKFQIRLDDDDYEILEEVLKRQGGVREAAKLIRDGALICRRDYRGKRIFEPHPLVKDLLNHSMMRKNHLIPV
ncbi:MAG: hypothetical protein GY795_18975 [Desulfobacterales bacterium]|nr:hypothetical protein [Desulfobacterales bacterium]